MKKIINIITHLYTWMVILFICLISCDDSLNNWTIDKNYAGLFRPLTFDIAESKINTITLRYSQIVNAKKYIFEFYKDSLEFKTENFSRTDTILADTLSIFSDNDTRVGVSLSMGRYPHLRQGTHQCRRR